MATRIGLLLVTVAALIAASGVARADDAYHILIDGTTRTVISNVLDRATRRLSRADCRRVFDDFIDAAGRPLSDAVNAAAKPPEELLARLYFVNGDGTSQCGNENVPLFTTPGSRVVHVCAAIRGHTASLDPR